MAKQNTSGRIYAGTGGWTFAPWRGRFYPKGLRQADELAFAAEKLTSIEINATFYRLQKPESFRRWAQAVPDGFQFALKGPRLITHRQTLADGADFLKRFLDSGPSELGDRLGPLLWQFAPTKQFDEADFGRFLELLPRKLDGRALRHAVEVSHDSFVTPAFPRLLRDFGVAAALIDSDRHTPIADLTADFIYARLERGSDAVPTGYAPDALDRWAIRAKAWAKGGALEDLLPLDTTQEPAKRPRDVYAYFIRGGKERAPHAAMALIERLSR